MKVLSVNVGTPREVEWRSDLVETAIYKAPVSEPVIVRRLNLDGDRQADLSVHGGPEKAVYVYPSEHYDDWRAELPGEPLPWGTFGENLTTKGLLEPAVRIGDVLKIGTSEFVVTQPRIPCFKLNVRFQKPDMVKRFLRAGRSGFYLSVSREGWLQAGDPIELLPAHGNPIGVSDLFTLYTARRDDQQLLQRAIDTPALPEAWRDYFQRRRYGGGAKQ
jgi:MOSC domain-containing protein YiiM